MKVRRRFAMLVVVLGLVAGLTSVGGPTPAGAQSSTATLPMMPATVPASRVNPNGVVRLAWAIVPATIDPHQVRENSQVGMFYETLFYIDAQRRVYQGLATGYTISPDKDTITITLRNNARFADGTTVDAAAVKASLDRARALPTSTVRAFLSAITSVQVVNASVVRLNLREFDATLIYSLGNAAGSVINPKALNSDLSKKPAGSTPYDLKSFLPTRRLVAERRPGATSWDPNAFKVKRVEFHAVNDATAAINGMKTRKFEIARINLTTKETKARLGSGFEYLMPPGDGPNVVYLRDRGALAQPNVRRAIAQAIDFKSISERVIDRCDYAPQLVRRGDLGFLAGYNPYSYDKAGAKRVLDGRNIRINAAVANFGDYPLIAQVAKQQLEEVGVDLRITLLSPTEAITQYFTGQRDALVLAYGAQADITMTINNEYLGSARSAGSQASVMAAQVTQANKYSLGSKERASAVRSLTRTAMEMHTVIPVCHINPFYVTVKNLKGIEAMENAWTGLAHIRPLVITK